MWKSRASHVMVVVMGALCAAAALAAEPPAPSTPADPKDYTETPALWTCGAEDWGPWIAECVGLDSEPAAGKWCVLINYNSVAEYYYAFPKWRNANWDLSGVEYLEFKVKLPKGVGHGGPTPTLYLRNQDGPFIRIQPKDRRPVLAKESDGQWQAVRIPIKDDPEWETFRWLNASVKKIDFFEVAFFYVNVPRPVAHYVMIDDVHFGPVQPAYTPPNEQAGDLDVLVIERTPTYERYQLNDYDGIERAVCVNKDKKHYPDKGEEVTFTAHVQNKGKAPLAGKLVWLLDGKEVASGDATELKPRDRAEFAWKWPWDPADHDISFKVTPAGEDYCPKNNELTVRNNAMMWKHVIERGTLARVEQKTNMIGSYSFEDWLQGQARFMNQLFAESKYDFAPNGITARVTIGRIEYVDDGQIAAVCKDGPFRVGEQDIRYDGGRGCTMQTSYWDVGVESPCFLNFVNFLGRQDGAWLHEMSHQNGIIDDYQFITAAVDNKVNGVGFHYAQNGLMGGGEIWPFENPGTLYSLYAPGDVFGYNIVKGKRHGYFGEYLYCVAKENALVIKDMDDKPVANAEIKVYQSHINDQGRGIDGPAVHEGKTDAQGRFPLKNRPVKTPGVTETGCELHDNPFGPIHVVGFNGVFLVTVKPPDGKELYGFTTVQDFNLAWARGQKDKAEIPVSVKVKEKDGEWYTAPPPKK